MTTKIINPWDWQDQLGFNQAIVVQQNTRTVYCSGQTAMSANGQPVEGSMAEQLALSLENLEKVLAEAGCRPGNIVRLNLYTTSVSEFFSAYGTLMAWINLHGVKMSSTLLEVSALAFPQLKVEIEAIAVL